MDTPTMMSASMQSGRTSHRGIGSASAQPILAVASTEFRFSSPQRRSARGTPLNLARFDLVTFQLVILCAERGSLCEAAKVAHISKSAASHRITSLEEHLGKKLFHRHHYGLQLTDAGVVCAERIRLIIEEIRGLGDRLASM